ncbi:Hypothetical predicted protein [Pelobates cultripes]|uniref:Uncharacterized protein n=1 Tax=Pelobates cultripes TaxID=61616 RepID=A0AAD1S2A7_PELCU|nr:Hypothetical predicted protein [Pelobates cultripes]
MAPTSPSAGESMEGSEGGEALTIIRQELAQISAQMLTKADTGNLLHEFRTAVREEISALRTDLAAVEVRVDALETETQAYRNRHRAAKLATTRQGNLLLTLRRQVEDLENRTRRQNIMICGLPEPDSTPLQETVRALFRQILGERCPTDLHFDRIHRALGPQRQDGKQRDALCCLHAYSLKDQLITATRGTNTITFQGAEVALFQDLSSLTLDARRALRPITVALRDRNILYRTLRIPPVHIRNWLLETLLAPRGRPADRDAHSGKRASGAAVVEDPPRLKNRTPYLGGAPRCRRVRGFDDEGMPGRGDPWWPGSWRHLVARGGYRATETRHIVPRTHRETDRLQTRILRATPADRLWEAVRRDTGGGVTYWAGDSPLVPSTDSQVPTQLDIGHERST